MLPGDRAALGGDDPGPILWGVTTATTGRRLPADWRDWVGLAARLVLGGVLLVAGGLKLPNLGESVIAVRAYQLLPFDATTVVGYLLPILEVATGLLLVLGLFTRVAAFVGSGLMVAFIVGIASVWIRGISIDCGCFGGGGAIDPQDAIRAYPWEILRDVGLLVCGVWLLVRPRTPWAVDNWLFRPLEVDADDAVEEAARPRP